MTIVQQIDSFYQFASEQIESGGHRSVHGCVVLFVASETAPSGNTL